jgi:molybdopterin molybdotransferase
MVERRKPIKVNEAIQRVMNYKRNGSVQLLSIEDSYGHFLGQDLIADHDVPFFDRSPYDGFAIRAADTEKASRENPITFEVIGEIGAGSVFEGDVSDYQAVRIMTGAQIPDSCDAVVMLELANQFKDNGKPYFDLKRSSKVGQNISFTGEDTKKGTVLASKGTFINPGIVALLATFGYKQVPVSVKPKIGIIATGSELLEVDQPLEPGKIRNSNAYMVHAQVKRAGGEPIYLGQFSDDFDMCFKQVSEALDKVDLLITTGGVSVGDYDYLPAIYEKLGANVLFNKIAMRPGSVTTVAEFNGKLLFGLSGNPSACYVGFELFTRPIIREYLHMDKPFLKKEVGILGADFKKANPFDRFVRGLLRFENGSLIANPVGLDKSNVVSSLGLANILIQLPGGTKGYEAGMEVSVILLEDQEGANFNDFLLNEINFKRSIRNG